jgi:excisionase family DNA binding protein
MNPTTKPENSALMTVNQAGQLLQYRPAGVYDLISRGVLPAIQIGNRYRIRRSDLDAMLHANRTFSRKEALS